MQQTEVKSYSNAQQLNNKVIEECYITTKKREYVQQNLGEDDILESPDKKHLMHDKSEIIDNICSVDVNLITNDWRLHVNIPHYENHYRQYFENPEGFHLNQ